MKYIQSVRKHFGEKPVFSIRDLRTFLNKQKISKNYSYVLLNHLLKRGEIHRIAKGIYSFQNDLIVAGFAFTPFYYGLQEALSLRNLWEQETNPVILTTKKIRTGTRTIMDSNVLVRRINRKMFFGFELIKQGNYWLPVSDIEKTLIDLVYFKEPLTEKVLNELKKRMKKKQLNSYLKKCNPNTRKQVKKIISQ